MSQSPAPDVSWIIFRLQQQFFGLPVAITHEMLVVPEVTPVPKAPPYVRGMINLRGRVMPLIDLRTRLGLPSALDEKEKLIHMLEEREEDHKNWLVELETSVRERRKFRLTTDPHQCAFGKWYDGFQTDDLRLAGQLIKFDFPHRRVHAVGEEVADLAAKKDYDGAMALIGHTRDTVLAKLVALFGEVRETVRKSHTEIAVVVEDQGRVLALTVDAVDSVETLEPGSAEAMTGSYGDLKVNLISQIGRRQEGGAMVLLMDVGQLMRETSNI
ncbi:MAG: chemotaxis protein CheW [Pseudomonadota bacterium]